MATKKDKFMAMIAANTKKPVKKVTTKKVTVKKASMPMKKGR